MKSKEKIAFTLRIDKELAAKIDYVAEYYGRNRTGEIIWTMKRHVAEFEKEIEKIDLEETVTNTP